MRNTLRLHRHAALHGLPCVMRLAHSPPMSNALLLLPDLLLIVCGFLICRYTPLNRAVWEPAEKLVYYLFFPVLLFNSIVRSPLQPRDATTLAVAGMGLMLIGIVMAYALRALPGIDKARHAAGAQVAFRFNSFIALALAERFGGASGVAGMALLLALCVPLANVAAVYPLARQGGHSYVGEIFRNPLILATLAGLLANLGGLQFPDAVATTLQRIGLAALPIGLMAVGAGLRLSGLRKAPRLAAMLLTIRHVALPLVAMGLTLLLVLPPEHRVLVLLFSALPTASSCYVLATRMGGDGAYVAGLVTVSTLLGMLLIPFWLAVMF